jgi:hypothetical protein
MAGFFSNSKQDAEKVLRDFPANWTRESGSIGRTFYRCRSDDSVIAVIAQDGKDSWYTGVDVDLDRDGDASREARDPSYVAK